MSQSSSSVREFGHVDVQSDWEVDVARGKGEFWISSRPADSQTTLYGHVRVEQAQLAASLDQDNDNAEESKENFTASALQQGDKLAFALKCERSGVDAVIAAPQRSFRIVHGKAERGKTIPVFALAVSPVVVESPEWTPADRVKYKHKLSKEEHCVASEDYGSVAEDESAYFDTWRGCLSASTNGSVRCFKSDHGQVVRDCSEQHKGDVNAVRFFPSGQIALSGGSDAQLKIWLLDLKATPTTNSKPFLAQCVTSLVGHGAAVTACDIVGRGKRVASTSRDGQAIVWDVSTQQPITTFKFEQPNQWQTLAIDDVHVIDEHSLVTASQDGFVRLYDLRTNQLALQQLAALPSSGVDERALHCVRSLSGRAATTLAVGCASGALQVLDTRRPEELLHSVRRQRNVAVNDLQQSAVHGDKIWAATNDGQCTLWSLTDTPSIQAQLTGSDMDPLYTLQAYREPADASDVERVLTAGYDGVIRHYRFHHKHTSN